MQASLSWYKKIKQIDKQLRIQLKEYFFVYDKLLTYHIERKYEKKSLRYTIEELVLRKRRLLVFTKNIIRDLQPEIKELKRSLPPLQIFNNENLLFLILLIYYYLMIDDIRYFNLCLHLIVLNIAYVTILKFFKIGIFESYLYDSLDKLKSTSLLSPRNEKSLYEIKSLFKSRKELTWYIHKDDEERYYYNPFYKLKLYLISKVSEKYRRNLQLLLRKKKIDEANQVTVKMISELRTRYKQSVKSLARIYYLTQRNIYIMTHNDETENVEIPEPVQVLIQKLKGRFYIYSHLSNSVTKFIYSKTKIPVQYIERIFNNLLDYKNREIVDEIIEKVISYGAYTILLENPKDKEHEKTLFNRWINSCYMLANTKKSNNLRELLATIIYSDELVRNKYYGSSLQYQRKFIQSVILIVAYLIWIYRR